MKSTSLLFLTMSWAMLTHGTRYAAPSSGAPPTMKTREAPWSAVAAATAFLPPTLAHLPYEPKAEGGSCCYRTPRRLRRSYFHDSAAAEPLGSIHPVDERGDHGRASNMSHPPHRASLTKANRPKQLPNSRQRSLPGNLMNLHQPGSNKSGGAAKGGLFQSEPVNNALAVRTPSVVRPTVPPPNNVHHRSPNPAVVAGSVNSDSRNTGAINGTRMNRKP